MRALCICNGSRHERIRVRLGREQASLRCASNTRPIPIAGRPKQLVYSKLLHDSRASHQTSSASGTRYFTPKTPRRNPTGATSPRQESFAKDINSFNLQEQENYSVRHDTRPSILVLMRCTTVSTGSGGLPLRPAQRTFKIWLSMAETTSKMA